MGCATLLKMRDRATSRQHGERKAVKERCRCEAQSAYLFPNISPCSHRSPSRPAVGNQHCSTHLILAAIPRTSESVNVAPRRDVHDDSSPVFGHLARRSYWTLTIGFPVWHLGRNLLARYLAPSVSYGLLVEALGLFLLLEARRPDSLPIGSVLALKERPEEVYRDGQDDG